MEIAWVNEPWDGIAAIRVVTDAYGFRARGIRARHVPDAERNPLVVNSFLYWVMVTISTGEDGVSATAADAVIAVVIVSAALVRRTIAGMHVRGRMPCGWKGSSACLAEGTTCSRRMPWSR